jgi:signal transduction histidine kinase
MIYTAVVRDMTDARRRERHETSLAAASDRLARSLDYAQTIAAVASLPVPVVGAWAILDLIGNEEGGDRQFRRLASRHSDAGIDAALQDWAATPLDDDSPEAVIDVVRRGEPLLLPSVSDDWLGAHAASGREEAIFRSLGMRSLLIVPLRSGTRTLGAWTIGSPSNQNFDEHDLALAAALADRAAMAIDNAQLFDRARRATAARDQVLQIVSHDLRNPLSALSMLARRLTDGEQVEEVRRIGSHILASAEWMHRLMQDLLDAASIDAGRLAMETHPAELAPVVNTVVSMFGDRAAQQRIDLQVNLPPDLPAVLADAGRVSQLLSNLVGNAVKFTPEGGTIEISAAPVANRVEVRVRDTGSGIPDEELTRIFDRFWQSRRGSATPGSGLGLAIAQGIARAHGGEVRVDSVVGSGSTFTFSLPVATKAPGIPGAFADQR